jgi:hypothetical protein
MCICNVKDGWLVLFGMILNNGDGRAERKGVGWGHINFGISEH